MDSTGPCLDIAGFRVELHADFPGAAAYVSSATDERLLAAARRGFEIVYLDVAAEAYRSTLDPGGSVTFTAEFGEKATYLASVSCEGRPVGRVRIEARPERGGLCLQSEIVEEADGFQIQATVMEVFRVPRTASGAALAFANRCGRLVDLHNAKPEKVEHIVDWYEPTPVAIAVQESLVGVLSVDTADSQLFHEVREAEGSVSVELIHRHRCDHPANSFLAQQTASCLLRFADAPKGQRADWTLGAAILRDDHKPHVQDLYVDSIVYKVMLQIAHAEEVTTYDDVWELIQRVNRLTCGARQVVYLVGWQHHGHDTGYPDVYTPNYKVGTFEDFKALKEKAKALNAIVSLHDNYHDTYMDSPLWDPRIVCVNPDGELRKGGVWGGGQAYEIGPTKYVAEALPRAKRTVEMLDLEQTTHLDVLSDKPNMVDFDVERPANREQNAEAKRLIVEAFRAKGVDVTSEVLTSPFTPWMHHFWHAICAPAKDWSAEEPIPLVPFVYHGKVTAGGDVATPEARLRQIAYGLTFSVDWSKETPDSEIMDLYYLVGLPWSLLAKREITGFERAGGWDTVHYGPDSYVRVNYGEDRYEVVVDGETASKDYGTLCRRADGKWIDYSRKDRKPKSGRNRAEVEG